MDWLKDILLKDSEGKFSLDNLSTLSKVLGGGLGAYGIGSLLAGGTGNLNDFLGIGGGRGSAPVGYQGGIPSYTAQRTMLPMPQDPNRRPGSGGRRYFSDVAYEPAPAPVAAAQGGLMSLPQSKGYYLGGPTDGMADKVPANIDGRQEARLSDGEFVMPADIVSHLGNGNSEAGAKVLYDMMDRVRRARTGRPEQGRQINPNKYTPA
jgi:hypothetical protein